MMWVSITTERGWFVGYLTTLFQLLYSVEWGKKVNDETERIWMEAVVAKKVL
jgi:hypothetical protein